MFPLKDNIPSSRPPYVNYLIIGVNGLVFLWELSMGPYLQSVVQVLGFVPARFLDLLGQGAWSAAFLPMFTALFLHGGWLHILGNMWFLYVFGDNVEDILGHGRYLLFYLACGVGANLIFLSFSPSNTLPLIGASGAIAGVMGAYFYLFPGARILTLFLIIFIPIFLELPAYFFLGLWFVMQFLYGTFSLHTVGHVRTGAGGVAWWAHVGGFLVGIMLLYLLVPKQYWALLQRRHSRRSPEEGGF